MTPSQTVNLLRGAEARGTWTDEDVARDVS